MRSTCLVQYHSNRYSVPAQYAGRHISLRAYANQKAIAEHNRQFTKNISYFEPWHYVPLLASKPGDLRDGAPFLEWELPTSMNRIRSSYMKVKGGDRDFVELLMPPLSDAGHRLPVNGFRNMGSMLSEWPVTWRSNKTHFGLRLSST